MPIGFLITSITPAVLLLATAAAVVRRKLHRQFPFFLAYTLFSPAATAVRLGARGTPVGYFLAYWTTEAVYGLLALLVLNEVFKHLFEHDYRSHWWFRLSLPVAAMAIAVIFLVQPVGQITRYRVTNAVFSFDLGMHCLEVLIMLFFLLLDKIFTAVDDPYDYGIVRGFGVSAGVTILADVARSHFGSGFTIYFTYAHPIGFIAATLIWLHAFLRKPQARQRLPITLRELLALMGKQGEVLGKIVRNWKLWRYESR